MGLVMVYTKNNRCEVKATLAICFTKPHASVAKF